jgi:NTP pyrophosphatase (non-canonical NTP hydrolase)
MDCAPKLLRSFPVIKHDDSLKMFQKHLRKMYQITNDRLYLTPEIVILLQKSTTTLLKAVRKGNETSLRISLPLSFGWLCAVGNRMHIDLEGELFRYFPEVCPYCGRCPCQRELHNSGGRKRFNLSQSSSSKGLSDCQLMLAKIYPNNTLIDSAQHLVEEVSEVAVALYQFTGTHKEEYLNMIALELIDVFAHLCAVATCSGIDLAESVTKMFGSGCPNCNRHVCVCTFSSHVERI